MGWLNKLGDVLSGDGLAAKTLEFVNTRWPPSMSDQQKAEMEVVLKDLAHRQTLDLMSAAREDEALFNERTIALEGTAKDLQAIPILGHIVIFLRGSFRPAFAYATFYWDFVYFVSGMRWTDRQETLLLVINLLVLVFFFGERAMKNVMPLITQVFIAKNGS